ncbi:hypothetical protein ACGFS9_30020 [Streptomyces sp. NPDC048566]|uniref:hypothetical protein n=1 Tax=Streptomyces sp. NPDC048566 TaxID=3365569 RepID=UPI00371C7A04
MATNLRELMSHWYQLRARTLVASDVRVVCGHGAADSAACIHPVSRGGARLDRPRRCAPIHPTEFAEDLFDRYGLICPPRAPQRSDQERGSCGIPTMKCAMAVIL